MILDGDILAYFDSIHKNVRYTDGQTSAFEFNLDYLSLHLWSSILLNHTNDMVSFVIKINNVLVCDEVYRLLNEFNNKSILLKAYYDKTSYQIIVKGNQYAKEENLIYIIEGYTSSIKGDEYDILEELYKYKGTLKDSSKDDSLDTLMGLLSKS